MSRYEFPARARFVNRESDLAAMERWWASGDRNALNLYGRRRVGKSPLLDEFARDKRHFVFLAAEGT